jgi:hypothetical protein
MVGLLSAALVSSKARSVVCLHADDARPISLAYRGIITVTTYIPLFQVECNSCGTDPVVGIREPTSEGIRSTGLCGSHFFQDLTMWDWEVWNEQKEDTE